MIRYIAILFLFAVACYRPGPTTLPGAKVSGIQLVYFDDPDYADSLESAVDFWNDALDTHALAVTDDPAAADIMIMSAPVSGERLGSTDPGGRVIYYHRPGDIYQAYLTFAHELGHAAFYLAHDDEQPCSIMYPHIGSTFDMSGPRRDMFGRFGYARSAAFRCALVMDEDRDAIRRLIGR